jgi:hypothetical protein
MPATQNGMPTPIASTGSRTAAVAPPAIQFMPENADGIQL